MIKEPEVNGVIFKSLTHAKWSIFFSNIECEWEYRPEGFTLDNGNFFIAGKLEGTVKTGAAASCDEDICFHN